MLDWVAPQNFLAGCLIDCSTKWILPRDTRKEKNPLQGSKLHLVLLTTTQICYGLLIDYEGPGKMRGKHAWEANKKMRSYICYHPALEI